MKALKTRRLEGWIFDAYPEPGGMRVWVLDRGGAHHAFLDPWKSRFYIGADDGGRRASLLLSRTEHPVDCRLVERLELFSGEALPVLEVRVPPPGARSPGQGA